MEMNRYFLSFLEPQRKRQDWLLENIQHTDGHEKWYLSYDSIQRGDGSDKSNISLELALFLRVHPSLRLSMVDIVQAFTIYCKKPDLQGSFNRLSSKQKRQRRRWFYLNKNNRNLWINSSQILCDQKLASFLEIESEDKIIKWSTIIRSINKHTL
jgi:hypothetical protein